MADSITVQCPDCMAPPGTPCRMSAEDVSGARHHADRQNAADLTEAGGATGTCGLCAGPVYPPLGCPAHGFSDVTPAGPLCPECKAGKTPNCAGTALDPVTDEFVPCATVTGSPT